jgi:hypothetical protein
LDWSIAFGPRRDGRRPFAEPKREQPQRGAAPDEVAATRFLPGFGLCLALFGVGVAAGVGMFLLANSADKQANITGVPAEVTAETRTSAAPTGVPAIHHPAVGGGQSGLQAEPAAKSAAAGAPSARIAPSDKSKPNVAATSAPPESTATSAAQQPSPGSGLSRVEFETSGGQSGLQAEPATKSAAAGTASARVAPSDKSKPNVAATSAPPKSTATSAPQQPSPGSGLSGVEIETLLSRGDWLFANGDVASARLLYRRAADAGEARAVVRLRKTFDPVSLDHTRETR